jgi:uncharacterized coiled-coil protein SlyX
MKSILLLTLFTLTYCGLAFSETDSVVEPENASAVLEDMVAETKARLDLTDEQVEQVTPILQSSFESRRAILLEYGIDIESRKPPAQKLGFRKARTLGKELDSVRASTLRELDDILTEEQLSEYVAMQNERKNKMRERLRASR